MKLIAQSTKTTLFKYTAEHPLLYDINRIPLFHLEKLPEKYKNANQYRLVVSDTGEVVGLVSDKFVLTQPREVILSIVSPFIDDIDSWKLYYSSGSVAVRLTWKTLLELEDLHIKPGVLIFDSVTKRYRLKICSAPYISECGNELLVTSHRFSRRHVGLIKSDLKGFINKFKEWLFNLSFIRIHRNRMESEVIDKETFNRIIDDLDIPEKYLSLIHI